MLCQTLIHIFPEEVELSGLGQQTLCAYTPDVFDFQFTRLSQLSLNQELRHRRSEVNHSSLEFPYATHSLSLECLQAKGMELGYTGKSPKQHP
jgi:hypothetical protein